MVWGIVRADLTAAIDAGIAVPRTFQVGQPVEHRGHSVRAFIAIYDKPDAQAQLPVTVYATEDNLQDGQSSGDSAVAHVTIRL